MYRSRIKKFQEYLKRENLDAFIICSIAGDIYPSFNIRYLCGFSGDTGVLIINTRAAYLLCDSRFHEQARKEVRGAKVVPTRTHPLTALKDITQFRGRNLKYGFESEFLTCNERRRLKEYLGDVLLIPTIGVVSELSVIKDKTEVALIQKAADISDTAFERILGYLKPGLREIEVCAELEYQMKMLGSSNPAFATIVASGYRSALPHGLASEKKIARGDFVTFDFGACYKGYVSDITRTVVMGKAISRQKKIYNVVLRSQMAGIRKVRSGVSGKAVDVAARKVIDKAGYKKYFGHGTGHGIGIYFHVAPSAGPRSTDVLKRGMVLTVEPGIYIPGWGGVRIEDDVLVTNTGGKVLNKAPKNLLEV
ncbi:MAG: aminopeptidase P family protein [Candidatus Zixiibacteriota bacterium]|nr:MAG: aminopeptidase P family protein [candidate division Zixibacteria bacterium]